MSLTLESPLESFVDRYWLQQFEGSGKLYTVTITGVAPPLDDNENTLDRPRLSAKVTPHTAGYKQDPLFKAQVVDQLEQTDKLKGNDSYELYNGLTSARFVATANMLLDVRAKLARISELTQRDSLNLNSLNRKLSVFEKDIQWLLAKSNSGSQNRGSHEANFFQDYNQGTRYATVSKC